MITVSRSPAARVSVLAVLVAAILAAAFLPGAAHASNDPLFAEQWSLAQVGAPAAWTRSTGTAVRIGIVDTGVDLAHEDLAGQVVASTNCVGSNGDPAKCSGTGQDDHGHGTHVAGIVAAVKDNGKGIAGVAPDAHLLVAKALSADGSGTTEDINAGIHWVVDHGARVVSLSLGGDFLLDSLFGTSLDEGVQYAWSRGAIPVLAAGNTNLLGLGIGSSQYGNLPVIVVGAVGPNDLLANYSSPPGNARWSVVGPGGAGTGGAADVISTFWGEGQSNQYKALAGTSMATPHVAGVIALVLAQGLSQQAAVDRVLATADKGISCGLLSSSCAGRLNAAAATGAAPVTTSTPARTGLLGLPIDLGLGL